MRKILNKIDSLVWYTPLAGKPAYVRWPVLLLRLVLAVVRDVGDGSLSLRATSLVYTTLLSLAPLLAICFSVLKGFGVHNQIEPFLREFLSPLGEQGKDITENIVRFVDNIQVGLLGVVGVGLLVYSVISLMHKIETAFNAIWNVGNARSFPRRVRDYLGVLLIGPLFMFLSVGMTASLSHADLVLKWLDIDLVNMAFDRAFSYAPFFLFMLAFAAIYSFMPNCKVRLVPALVAGAVTAFMWKSLGYLFGVFVAGSANYATIYSAFAALVLFMIWLYVGWLIVLVGASISYYLQNPSNQRLSRKAAVTSLRMREKIALGIVTEVGKSFYAGQKAPNLADLARGLRLPAQAIESIVTHLVAADILAQTGEQMRIIPAKPLDVTTIADMFTALRRADEAQGISYDAIATGDSADKIMALSDKAMRVVLGGITLKQLVMGEVEA